MYTEPQEKNIKFYFDDMVAISAKLPTGAKDPNAMNKFYSEIYEAYQEADGSIEKTIEYIDCLYYLCKAHHTELIAWELFLSLLSLLEKTTGYKYSLLFQLCYAKYEMRAQEGNPKDEEKEYNVISKILQLN